MRDFGVKFADLPEWVRDELDARVGRLYRLPPWVSRIPSERYRHRAKITAIRQKVRKEAR